VINAFGFLEGVMIIPNCFLIKYEPFIVHSWMTNANVHRMM